MGPRERVVLSLLFIACARGGSGTSAPPPTAVGVSADAGADAGGDGAVDGATGGSATTSRGGSPAAAGDDGDGAQDSTNPYAEPTEAAPELPARTFRLSHDQYAASVEALVGKSIDTSNLEPELDNGIYRNMSSSGLVRTDLLAQYYAKARQVTNALDDDELRALVPGHELDDAHKERFIETSVKRAFRRPATSAELEDYGALFDLAASEGEPTAGFRTVLRALLASPHFLYRTEIGEGDAQDTFSLTEYEIASLLSYGILGRPPSDELTAAAEQGELTRPDALEGQVRALVGEERARDSQASFASEWLELDGFEGAGEPASPPFPRKDADVFPGFDDVREAMRTEALGFITIHAGLDATLPELLTSDVPEATGELGKFYRSDPSGAGGSERHGVLALGALLALGAHETRGSPTERGLFVRKRLLCQEVHPPDRAPPALGSTTADAEARTTRELYERHAKQAACAGCHAELDAIGFTLEGFDGAGRFRTRENGFELDTSGELTNTDRDRSLKDHRELAEALADSEWVRECVAKQAFRWYFGELEPERGVPPIQAARRALAGGTFGDALVALWSTASTYRRRREP